MNRGNGVQLLVFALLAFTYTGVVQAQQQRIRTDDHVVQLEELANKEVQYLYSADREGSYYWRGSEEDGIFNFNVLFGLFHYTDARGQAQWLEPADVDSVRIGQALFLPFGEEGFFQVIPESEELLIRHLVDVDAETRVRGAYGTTDETASVEVLHTLTKGREGRAANHHAMLENPGGQQLHINLERKQHFYFLADDEPVGVYNRRALQRAFPDHSRQIRRFVRRQDIDFDRAEDLIQVLDYVESL